MLTNLAKDLAKEMPVGMGQAVVTRPPARLTSILGSCVAITMYAPKLQLGMLSHVVLPSGNGNLTTPAKFADTAVPYMLSVMKERGARHSELVAKVTGGACMFGGGRFMDIGDSNARVALAVLEAARIPVVARDIAGTVGRRICFDLSTGDLTVDSPGHPSRTI
jgi:chemotaxis protein CheD